MYHKETYAEVLVKSKMRICFQLHSLYTKKK